MFRRTLLAAFLAATLLATPGCALLHEMKPHRLERWNRGPKLGRDTTTFSVDDTAATNARDWDERMDALLAD